MNAAVPPNNALKLTAHGGGPVGCGAPQLNAVFDGLELRWWSGATEVV